MVKALVQRSLQVVELSIKEFQNAQAAFGRKDQKIHGGRARVRRYRGAGNRDDGSLRKFDALGKERADLVAELMLELFLTTHQVGSL